MNNITEPYQITQPVAQALPILNQNLDDLNDSRDYRSFFGMTKFERGLCIFLIIISTIYYNIVNVLLFKKRKSYVIKHRGIILTLPAAISSYIITMNILLNELTYSMEFHNFYIYINNILIVFVIMSACGRAIRLILLYKLNAFKSECILQIQDFSENPSKIKPPKVEVNSYMKTVDNMVKKKTGKWLLIVSFGVTILITALMEYFKEHNNKNHLLIKIAEFAPINLFLTLFNGISIYFMYALRKVKDNETFGIKFELYCSFIVGFIVFIVSLMIYIPEIDVPWLVEYTHSGSYLYIIQTTVGHFISGTIPLILCYYEEKKFKKQSKILSSAEFSKLLYQKTVIDDLKVIAINDFCVENILFWETYIKIKELTYQCLTNTGIFEEKKTILKEENIQYINKNLSELYSNSDHSHHKFIDKREFRKEKARNKRSKPLEYDPYYAYSRNGSRKSTNNKDNSVYYSPRVSSPTKQYNKNYFTPDDYKIYDIDPNIPLDPRLVPYYISFYKAFIDPYGPVTVNISSEIASNIFKNLFNNPTVGVFDDAKNDIITSMFLTLYPQYINLHYNN